jgi:hypothetical protein
VPQAASVAASRAETTAIAALMEGLSLVRHETGIRLRIFEMPSFAAEQDQDVLRR